MFELYQIINLFVIIPVGILNLMKLNLSELVSMMLVFAGIVHQAHMLYFQTQLKNPTFTELLVSINVPADDGKDVNHISIVFPASVPPGSADWS